MTKKRKAPQLDDILDRPWCYYCERDFDDLAVLINHQKARHFKCALCPRRLNTAGGLGVHMSQVHKESLPKISDSLPHREDPNVEIFGMEGIPDDLVNHHRHTITSAYFRMVNEHRLRTGNPPPGVVTGEQSKKPKLESKEEMKARVLELKRKKDAEKAGLIEGSGSEGKSTPAKDLDTVCDSSVMSSLHLPLTLVTTTQKMTGTGNTAFQPPYQVSSAGIQETAFYPFGAPTTSSPAEQNFQGSMPVCSPHNPYQFGSEPNAFPQTYQVSYPYTGAPTPNAPYGWQPTPQTSGYPTFPGSPLPPVKSSPPPESKTLPPVPGLPQRPSFSMPNLNKEDMVHLHAGGKPTYPTTGRRKAVYPVKIPQSVTDLTLAERENFNDTIAELLELTDERANTMRSIKFDQDGNVLKGGNLDTAALEEAEPVEASSLPKHAAALPSTTSKKMKTNNAINAEELDDVAGSSDAELVDSESSLAKRAAPPPMTVPKDKKNKKNASKKGKLDVVAASTEPEPVRLPGLRTNTEGPPPTTVHTAHAFSQEAEPFLSSENYKYTAGPLTTSSKQKKVGKKSAVEDNAILVYTDNYVSPEEKMAKTKRYSFVPKDTKEIAMKGALTPEALKIFGGNKKENVIGDARAGDGWMMIGGDALPRAGWKMTGGS